MAVTPDEIRSKTVEALGLLVNEKDAFVHEEYLQSLLTVIYQAGRIDANNELIARNAATLRAQIRAADRAANERAKLRRLQNPPVRK
jgi:hypothetical protein